MDPAFPPLSGSSKPSIVPKNLNTSSSENTLKPKSNWSGAAGRSRTILPSSSADLCYRPPVLVDGRLLPYIQVKGAIEKAWNLKGELSMTVHEEKAFILKFTLEEDRITALEHGPMFISHTLFIVIRWEPFIEQQLENIQAIPVWMTIRKVPVYVFNSTGLSFIASVVGKPLLQDGPTAARTRMSFARVYVEINPKSVLKKEITVVFDDGYKCTVDADYAWKPAQCPSCSTFCYSEARCPKKVREQPTPTSTAFYAPKPKSNVATSSDPMRTQNSESTPPTEGS
ncbi:uncharacterized protein LOC113306276 [Papaver somniferum]|uniref:uncharacterized protein LOC113306276 n=1 Tax=Papaver somniferum TaxID=3469 RepID=UPI000E700376|nr:uncharacterized protein LOC113306276 [Papaver somniferum]